MNTVDKTKSRHISLYLASLSPRRCDLLNQLKLPFQQLAVSVDESLIAEETATSYTTRLALAKSQAGWHHQDRIQDCPVLGADTCIEYNGKIITKPTSNDDALDTLMQLNGKSHWVITAVALCQNDKIASALSETKVTFSKLTRQQIESYLKTGESIDKAGAYAIQGLAAAFIEKINGSYSGVVGLPLNEVSRLCQDFDITII